MEQICPILDRTTTVEPTGFCRDAWSIVRCRETGFVFLANPPEYSQLETEYAWEKTSTEERKRRELEEPFFSRVSAFLKQTKGTLFPARNKMASLATQVIHSQGRRPPHVVLDIGCGWGSLLVEIYKRFSQWNESVIPIGIEVSHQLARHAAERIDAWGGRILCDCAMEGIDRLDKNSIHVALMSSFLEHESQPLRLLRQLHAVLADDGAIVLKVPNFSCWNRRLRGKHWCGFRFPDHVNYFTPQTLRRLAHEGGFQVARQYLLDRSPLSDNMYAVLTKG